MNKDKLVIISVPFLRIAKSVLSDLMLEYLSGKSDIFIICPFESKDFRDQFSKYKNLTVINWKEPKVSLLANRIMSASEVMRMNGYWYKYRDKGMGYYSLNQYKNFEIGGKDKKKSLFNRLLILILSFLGTIPNLWKYVASLSLKGYISSVEIPIDTLKYSNTILIQSSSWGIQDRVLAHWAEGRDIHKVLLPYTTDQLIMNGYLVAEFDSVCVQGSLEYKYAREYHGIPESKIFKTGSLWFRVLDGLITEKPSREVSGKTVLYAGVSQQYYPREAEFLALEDIIKVLKVDENLQNVKIIYRPFIIEERERTEILNRFKNEPFLSYQWPNQLLSNVKNIENVDLNEVLKSDIENLSGIDVMIMSGTTSLGLDVSYISNCGIIGNFTDYNQVLQSRYTDVFFQDEGTICLPKCKVVKTNIELVNEVKKLLSDSQKSIDLGISVRSDWDYERKDFLKILDNAIFGV